MSASSLPSFGLITSGTSEFASSMGCTAGGQLLSWAFSFRICSSISRRSCSVPCHEESLYPCDAGYAHRDSASPTSFVDPGMWMTWILNSFSLACHLARRPCGPTPATYSLYHDCRVQWSVSTSTSLSRRKGANLSNAETIAYVSLSLVSQRSLCPSVSFLDMNATGTDAPGLISSIDGMPLMSGNCSSTAPTA